MATHYLVKASGGFRIDDEQLRLLVVEGIIQNKAWIVEYLAQQLFGPEMLTAQEVQGRLKISRSTLRRWEDRGIITPVRVGRTKRYAQNEIANLKNAK